MAFNLRYDSFSPTAVKANQQHKEYKQNDTNVLNNETSLHITKSSRQAVKDQPPPVLPSFGYYNPPEDDIAVEPVKPDLGYWTPPRPPLTEKEKTREEKRKKREEKRIKLKAEETESKAGNPGREIGPEK